jgi:hypothetical protein
MRITPIKTNGRNFETLTGGFIDANDISPAGEIFLKPGVSNLAIEEIIERRYRGANEIYYKVYSRGKNFAAVEVFKPRI